MIIKMTVYFNCRPWRREALPPLAVSLLFPSRPQQIVSRRFAITILTRFFLKLLFSLCNTPDRAANKARFYNYISKKQETVTKTTES